MIDRDELYRIEITGIPRAVIQQNNFLFEPVVITIEITPPAEES